MSDPIIQKLLNPTFDPEEAQELMRQAAVKIEQQSNFIRTLIKENENLRQQVEALVLDLGIKEGHYRGEVRN
jgi:hypothetical protein